MQREGGMTREFIQSVPQLRRWVAQCVRCQQMGYRPDTPPRSVDDLKQAYSELQLIDGLCADCRRMQQS